MSNFYIPSQGPDSWKEFLAEPDKQWKTGYSAKSLAYCWEEAQGFPKSVQKVFKECPYELFHSMELLIGIPEHKVPLPGGSTESQNDIYVLAKSGNELVSIAVEGKVNEPFGPTVSEKLKDPSPGVVKRLDFLCDLLQIKDHKLDSIRYQLLHRTASALIEAERFCTPHALMLVHSFSQEHMWFEDYAAFAKLYDLSVQPDSITYVGEISYKKLYLGWVTGETEYLEK
jgi:hypothetical protein